MLLDVSGRWWRCNARLLVQVALLYLIHLQQPVWGCQESCVKVLSDSSGSLTSPCYPSDYPQNQACKWTLLAPAGFIVQITFLDFELEEALGCIYDKVVVNTGSSDVKFCGLTANGLTLNSSGNVMEVSFNSDFSVQKKGFSISYKQVAVALRNQKVTLPRSSNDIVKISSQVSLPSVTRFTICLEIARSTQREMEIIFSLNSAKGYALAFGKTLNGMALIVDNKECSLDGIISSSDITSAMKPLCLSWSVNSGELTLLFDGNLRHKTCADIRKSTQKLQGLQLGAGSSGNTSDESDSNSSQSSEDDIGSFDGFIYNFRVWSRAMTDTELSALTCDATGDLVDWENNYWDIPASYAETDNSLSCSTAIPTSPSQTTSCASPALGCSEVVFHRVALVVNDDNAELSEKDVEKILHQWLNQTLRIYSVKVQRVSVQYADDYKPKSTARRFTCQALLALPSQRQTEIKQTLKTSTSIDRGLEVDPRTVQVNTIASCPLEEDDHYTWEESDPEVTAFAPCFPNKDQNASRTCSINTQNYTSYWKEPDRSNCTDIEDIEVSEENAAEVAVQLADISNNKLSTVEVSKVVTKVKELVNVARINATLARTVVDIISNVMTTSDPAQAAASETALKAVDELVQKIEFEGMSLTISSKNLAVGISSLNASEFNGTTFSAFIPPNTTDPKIEILSEYENPLAVVTLPATLLHNLSNANIETVARINFVFFSKTGLFQDEGANGLSLNSYVVASSVGNFSIRNLRDPVRIEIAHLQHKPDPKRSCVFWDFSLKGGNGGWSSEGCMVSEDSSDNRTVCLCNHLTHFGILMDIFGTAAQIDYQNTKVLTFITYIGCGVSTIFSAITLLTYITFEKLRRDYPAKILMNLSASLLLLNMVFLLDGWLASFGVEGLCISVAVLLHFLLLTSFTWMGLESIHMYIALVKVFNTYIRRYILKFCLVGWGLPALVVCTVVAIDKHSYGTQYYGKSEVGQETSKFCWIRSNLVFYVTCVGYFAIIFLMNVAMFIVVMIQICGRNGKRSNRTLREEILRNLRSVVSLTFLLGMTWGFALFAWGPVNLVFMYLFAIFNSLQGLFIFIFHCALKENVQKQWRRYLCCGQLRLMDNSDWSKTVTNNTKKVSSDNLGKSLSSSSFSSSTANWTSKAKATLNPFADYTKNPTDKLSSSSSNLKSAPSGDPASPITPVQQMLDKVKGYCSVRSDHFYKNFNH